MSTAENGDPAAPDPLELHPRLRQSLLSKYDDCALSARFDLDYGTDWSSHAAARGQIVHRAIAACLQQMVQLGESSVPVDVALAELDHVLRQVDVPMEGYEEQVVPIPLRTQADARVTMRTWAIYSAFDVEKIGGVERRFEATLQVPGPDGAPVDRLLTGKMDLLLFESPEHAIVVDWKDTFGAPPEKDDGVDDVSEAGYFQQLMYAWLLMKQYPALSAVTLREVYVRFLSGRAKSKKGKPINPLREATIDRAMLPEIETMLSSLVERFDRSVRTGKWRPAPGGHCSWCPRPEACTIFPTARGEGRITSQEDAERVAGRMLVARAAADQAAKALRSWSNRHGEIAVRDAKKRRVYGPTVQVVKVVPTPAELRRALANGVPPESLYREEERVVFRLHEPGDRHPQVAQVAQEEQLLAAMEKAAEERRKQNGGQG